jgi:hypothetical protein
MFKGIMTYFPLVLFVPGLLILWAAIVAEQPEARHNFLKAVAMYVCGIVLFVFYFVAHSDLLWGKLVNWLFHSST